MQGRIINLRTRPGDGKTEFPNFVFILMALDKWFRTVFCENPQVYMRDFCDFILEPIYFYKEIG
jgi:hypothetical protein